MDSVNLEVLRTAARWIDDELAVTLVTVVKTWGSSPRPEGSLLAINGKGRLVGSVSGGCIEDDLLDRLRENRPTLPGLATYGITAEQTRRFGLPCGGTLQLVLEPISRESRLDDLLARIEQGELIARRLRLDDGHAEIINEVPDTAVVFDGKTLVSSFGPRWTMLIIGAGQLSRYLAEFALALDYRVVVCDPREEFRESWDVPNTTIIADMPDDAVLAMRPNRRTVVIALTHDPKLDDLALIDALKSDAFYVGALGSKASNAKRRQRLKLFDLDDAALARLHGPVGLPIGSRTAPEIALAILADLVARRNGIELAAKIPANTPSI